MPHFRAGRIYSLGDQPEPDRRTAVWAFGANGLFVDHFVLVLLEPHELEALGTATDLR